MTKKYNWNDGKCMAMISNRTRRCNLKAKKNNDFCVKHLNLKDYDKNLIKKIRSNDIRRLNIKISSLNNEIIELCDENLLKSIFLEFNFFIERKYEFLDSYYDYTLMGLHNSWREIKLYNQIFIDNEYWDINIITNHISNYKKQCYPTI